MLPRLARHRWLWLTGALALLAGLSFWTIVFAPSLRNVTHGFPVYYSSARLIYEGRWSNNIYDDAWFSAEVHAQTNGRVGEVFWPNPPSTALMSLPLAGLDMADARVIWLVLSLVAVLAGLWLIVARLEQPPAFGLGLLALALAYAPLRDNFRIGQVYALLLFLFALAWHGAGGRRVLPAGLALGLAAATKLSGAPLWLVLAVRRRWPMLLAGGLAGLGVVLISCLIIGWENWVGYLVSLSHQPLDRSWMSVVAFQATHNFFRHLFVADPNFNPRPLWDQPWLASALSLLVSGAALGLTVWRARRADVDLTFAAGLTLSVILLPFTEEYHYILLLLPLAVMAAGCLRRPLRPRDVVWFAGVVLLLSVPWWYYFPALNEIAFGLLGYLRLYGGWLLWLWLIRRMGAPAPASAAEHLADV